MCLISINNCNSILKDYIKCHNYRKKEDISPYRVRFFLLFIHKV